MAKDTDDCSQHSFVELWPYNHAPRDCKNRTHCLGFIGNGKFVDNMTTTLIHGTVETRHVVIQYFRGKLYFNPDNTHIKERYIGTRITDHKNWINKYVLGEQIVRVALVQRQWRQTRFCLEWNRDKTRKELPTTNCRTTVMWKTAEYKFDETDFPKLCHDSDDVDTSCSSMQPSPASSSMSAPPGLEHSAWGKIV